MGCTAQMGGWAAKHETCNFLESEANRPKIRSNRYPIRKYLGTIGLIRQKVACFAALSQSSQDSFESESGSKKSRDDRLNKLIRQKVAFLDFAATVV